MIAQLDQRPVGQAAVIGQHSALMLRVLVEDVDGLTQHLVDRHGQKMLQRAQGLDGAAVHIGQAQVFRLAHHDVQRHVVEHLQQALVVALGLDLLGLQRPGRHGGDVAALVVQHGADQQVQVLAADLDGGPVGQVARVGQHSALMGRGLVEDVDRGADQIIRADRQDMLDRPQRRERGLVGVGDLEVDQVADHDVDRRVVQQLLEVGSPFDRLNALVEGAGAARRGCAGHDRSP
ncbi:hypothetical protein D3C80_858450 [compost metagenome]